MVLQFEVTGEAHVWSRHPQRIYVLSHNADAERDEAFDYAAVMAETDSPALARWLSSAVNACIVQSHTEGPRPPGRLLRHGSFRVAEDQFSADGRHYCVAWDVTLPRGSTIGYSTVAVHAQTMCDRLGALMAAHAEMSL